VTDRSFHHGNLRLVLLEAAADTLREQGLDGLSLRELARGAGVSHAAPRRHFPDRQALLDALAVDGFERLTGLIVEAGHEDGRPYPQRFAAVARVFVNFATDEAALLELMFTTKSARQVPELDDAAGAFFQAIGTFYASAPGRTGRTSADEQRLRRLLVATLQGIATLAAGGRIDAAEVEQLIEDATAIFA